MDLVPARGSRGAAELICDGVVIVADNGSTDATATVAAGFVGRVPSLQVVDASRQISSNAARNAGVRVSRGEEVLFADADDVVAPGWIEAMHDALRAFDIAGGSLDLELFESPRTLQWRPPYRVDDLEIAGNFLPYVLGAETWKSTVLCGNESEASTPPGCAEARRWNFSRRAQLAGFRIGFVPGAVVAYRLPEADRVLFRKIWISARGHPRLYRAFREAGMPRPRFKTSFLDWAWLGYHLPDLWRGSYERVEWARRLAWRAGLVAGSLRWRALYL